MGTLANCEDADKCSMMWQFRFCIVCEDKINLQRIKTLFGNYNLLLFTFTKNYPDLICMYSMFFNHRQVPYFTVKGQYVYIRSTSVNCLKFNRN